MVVTIEKAAGSSLPALQYNEKKVSKGDAEIVAYANFPSLETDDVKATLTSYENWSKSAKNLCFHASVNPSEHDSCSEEQVLAFIAEMMREFGYAQQPYLVYRHHDIERQHYHVVSVRSDKNGNRISAWHDRVILDQLMNSRGQDYGFEVGKGSSVGESESLRKDQQKKGIKLSHERFNPAEPVTEQLHSIIGWALSYNFTSIHQFQLILEHYGVRMKDRYAADETAAAFQGLDVDGKPVTGAIPSNLLGDDFLLRLAESLDGGVGTHSMRKRERARVENLVRSCFSYSHSQKHLENMLARHGVQMHTSYDDAGKAIGLTFIDHVTRTAFKGAELHKVLTPELMRQSVESGKWRAHDKGEKIRDNYVKVSRQTSAALRQAMVDSALNLGGRGGGSAGSAGGDNENEEKQKQREAALVDANISISNVAVSNVTSKAL